MCCIKQFMDFRHDLKNDQKLNNRPFINESKENFPSRIARTKFSPRVELFMMKLLRNFSSRMMGIFHGGAEADFRHYFEKRLELKTSFLT